MNWDGLWAGALTPWDAIGWAWILWAVSWLLAAVWSARTASAASYGAEAPNRIVSGLGAVLLFGLIHRLRIPLWSLSEIDLWGCFGVILLGIAFAWWARLHLGALWSGTVQRKAGHRIIESGPYALVRHPIYTGILLAAYATAVARGTTDAIAGALLLTIGFWMKARLEEQFLSENLGPDYSAYRKRVKMLAPYLF